MLTPAQKKFKKAQDRDNRHSQEVLNKLIPVPPRIGPIKPNKDYYIKISKSFELDSITYLWMSSALRAELPGLLRFFSKSDNYQVTLLEGISEEHGSTLLFEMFMIEGKVAVMTYDYKDIPFGETFRVFIAGDLKNSTKDSIDFDQYFDNCSLYKAYRRNFIDLKLAQEVARQYLKEGTRSDKVLWDEFLW